LALLSAAMQTSLSTSYHLQGSQRPSRPNVHSNASIRTWPTKALHPHTADRGQHLRVTLETDRIDVIRELCDRLPAGTVLEIVPADSRTESNPPAPAARQVPFDHSGMTVRQRDVVNLLVDNLSNKQIARKLDLSHFTVRNHISQVLRLLGVATRKEAIEALSAFVRSHGLGENP
jgi:DNA-binding CsgD family transcriptional regulator